MRLSELKTGERGVIVKVNGHGGFRKRIIEMGFVKGNKVKVILNAPLRDPIEYEIIGYKVSLRREEASKIEVISESEAKRMLSEREALPALDAAGEDYIEREMTHLAEETTAESPWMPRKELSSMAGIISRSSIFQVHIPFPHTARRNFTSERTSSRTCRMWL